MSKKSGPNPPHGTVVVKSGPNPPQGGSPAPPPQRRLTARPGQSAVSGTAAATAEATEPEQKTREETVSLSLAIGEPEPFSVFVKSDERGGVQVDSIEIRICEDDQPIFTALMDADLPVLLNDPAESHVFPFSEEQLKHALPHLETGETVEVKVHLSAPDNSQIKIGIIGTKHHHRLGRFIEHLFHRG